MRFTGSRPDAAGLLGLAEVVWVLGDRGGRNVALEALAACRPVIARRRPDLAEILGSETGFLVDWANPHEVARATRRILDDAAGGARWAENASKRAERFSVAEAAARWAQLCDSPPAPLLRGQDRLG